MNLTIPIRAENSNSSLRRIPDGKSLDQKRFIFSTVIISVVVSALVIGGVSSSLSPVFAKGASGSRSVDQLTSQQGQPSGQVSTTGVNTPLSTQPSAVQQQDSTAPVSTVPAPTTPAPSATVPEVIATAPVVPPVSTPLPTTDVVPDPVATPLPQVTPVATPQPVTPTPMTPAVTPPEALPVENVSVLSSSVPVATSPKVVRPAATVTAAATPSTSVAATQAADTAALIATMAAAQAKTGSQPVVYTSGRLSDEVRNRLIILAAVAAITGGLLYTMSFIGTTPTNPRRNIPIRYIFPVKEARNF